MGKSTKQEAPGTKACLLTATKSHLLQKLLWLTQLMIMQMKFTMRKQKKVLLVESKKCWR